MQPSSAETRLAVFDPEAVLTLADACEVLGISRSSIYRTGLERVRMAGGKVGFRAGDLLAHLRADHAGAAHPFPGQDNFTGLIAGATVDLDPRPTPASLCKPWRVLVLRGDGELGPTTIYLPPVNELAGGELVVIDHDDVAAQAPISLIAQEGECIRAPSSVRVRDDGRTLRLERSFGMVRLIGITFARFDDEWRAQLG